MKIEQYTYWSMTLNNPDENDWIMIKNPNEKYIRSLVWTREVGEEGTEHIQAWIRLQRNNSMFFMKKLYPRGHFKFIDRDEYNENTQQYAQKEDGTTAGKHHITLHDPLPASDTLLYKVLDAAFIWLCEHDEKVQAEYDELAYKIFQDNPPFSLKTLDTPFFEKQMVCERAGLEKIFCSPAYEKMKTTYWRQILFRLYKEKDDAYHSTTRLQESTSQEEGGPEVCEDNEDSCSETDEGSSESSSYETDEESDQ